VAAYFHGRYCILRHFFVSVWCDEWMTGHDPQPVSPSPPCFTDEHVASLPNFLRRLLGCIYPTSFRRPARLTVDPCSHAIPHTSRAVYHATYRSFCYDTYFPRTQVVFSNVKKNLGLDQARVCITAAAPISTEVGGVEMKRTRDAWHTNDAPLGGCC